MASFISKERGVLDRLPHRIQRYPSRAGGEAGWASVEGLNGRFEYLFVRV
jgi:hypothetical protein